MVAQNTERGRAFIEDRQGITQGEALDHKIARGRLNNVTQLLAPTTRLGLASGSFDAILLMQTLHDIANRDSQAALTLLETLFGLLRPGGVLGVSDHHGLPQYDNAQLHRMLESEAVALARRAGFRVESSELLRVATDDHSRAIFDPRLARNTDRFLLRLVKPEE